MELGYAIFHLFQPQFDQLMDLLFSNYPPLRTKFKSYPNTFRDLFQKSDEVSIATGYISTDSIVDLNRTIEINGGPSVQLCIGMQYFEGLTPIQKQAVEALNKTLVNNELGRVHMVTTFPFHGKISSFSKNKKIIGSLLGSSNLSNIVESYRQYEADVFLNNTLEAKKISDFIRQLITISSSPFDELDIPLAIPQNDLLQNQLGVKHLTEGELVDVQQSLTRTTFEIPLKGDTSQKSGLNASFGEGRKNPQGYIIPRPWYEVELIVPKGITSQKGYPQANTGSDTSAFEVFTDDGWKFKCKVSGDFSKNFRSADDLKILGKWIKGRLENSGVLRPGERVTDKTLVTYGRSSISFTKLKQGESWYLDFSN